MSNETHIAEDELVLYYYGEALDPATTESHMAGCEQCRAEYRSLQMVLNTVDAAPVPERGADYGAAVWQRIEKQTGAKRRGRKPLWLSWWVWAPVATALLVAAFLAGRLTQPAQRPTVASGQVRERILLVAVGDHLERSQMVLAEISNASAGKGKLDISNEQKLAEDLIDSNRLFRQTANSTGDAAVANVLDDLERMLLEIANSPSHVDATQLDDLRQEIEDRGLLFKIRVIGSQVQRQEQHPATGKQSQQDKGTRL